MCYWNNVYSLVLCFHIGGANVPPSDDCKPQQKTLHGQTEEKTAKESRSQKHNRVSVHMFLNLKDAQPNYNPPCFLISTNFCKPSVEMEMQPHLGNLPSSIFG